MLLCFLAAGDDILSFNTPSDGTLQLLTLVQYPPFPTHHQLKNATPTLNKTLLFCERETMPVSEPKPGWRPCRSSRQKPPPPPLLSSGPDPSVRAGTAPSKHSEHFFFSLHDDPYRSPASLPGAGSQEERGKFPQRMTSFLRGRARPPFFLVLPSVGSDCP